MIAWWRTRFGEEEIRRIADSISHEHVSQGAVTEEFEARLAQALDVPYVVATTSGSVALLLAMMALGVGRDDEVIVPNRTWIATAHAAMLLGAKVVLADVRSDVPLLDVAELPRKITPKTKAIVPVHLDGRSVEMDAVRRVAGQHGLVVIEDAAQAIFSRNGAGFLGTQSDAGCFSLSVAKLIATGQGGFVVTRSQRTCETLKLIRGHGVTDLINVEYTRLGFNFRFTDVHASIGIEQLARAAARIAHVKALYARYQAALRDVPHVQLIPVDVDRGEIPVYVEVLSPNREPLIQFLASRDIQVRPFYPGLDQAPYLRTGEPFPHADRFSREGLTLPSGPEQPLDNVERVVSAIRDFAVVYS